MRTSLELDDRLVEEARAVLKGPTLRAMIEDSLREAIQARQREALVASFGTWELAMSSEEIKALRGDRAHP